MLFYHTFCYFANFFDYFLEVPGNFLEFYYLQTK